MNYYLTFGLDSKNIVISCTVMDEDKNIEYCGDLFIGDRIETHPETMLSKHLFVYRNRHVPIPSLEHVHQILHTNLTTVVNKHINEVLMNMKLEEYII
jgi:hypothetical protein